MRWGNLLVPSVLALVGIVGTLVFYLAFKVAAPPQKQHMAFRQMMEEVDTLYRQWEEGPREWMCEDFFDPDIRYEQVYLQCNPNLLKCQLRDRKHLSFKAFVGTPESRRFGLVLTYRKDSLEEEFVFYDNCRDILLPEGLYALGEYRVGDDLLWDNARRRIFFDRTLVTRQDIINWPSLLEEKRGQQLRELNSEKTLLHFPARGLLLEEMKRFCLFRGKMLMQASVWDAASFLPAHRGASPPGASVVRTPYPWAKGLQSSFLQQDTPLGPDDCAKAYIRECPHRGSLGGIPLRHPLLEWDVPGLGWIYGGPGQSPEAWEKPQALQSPPAPSFPLASDRPPGHLGRPGPGIGQYRFWPFWARGRPRGTPPHCLSVYAL